MGKSTVGCRQQKLSFNENEKRNALHSTEKYTLPTSLFK